MNSYNGTEIAIIGLACQVPGADNFNEFWGNLKNSLESISVLSDEDLLKEGIDSNLLKNPSYVKANSFINNKEYFDSSFFGYTPGEAKIMDPQLRLFHENCWKALEDAGYGDEKEDRKIGLFAGGGFNNNWVNYAILSNLNNDVDNFTASQLIDVNFLCSRVSYVLNLQGPSVYLNTACSTSLVAIQKASMSLLLRECNMALAGGIKINNFSKVGYLYQEGMIGSKDGHCRPFDEESSGTVGGEGVGVVVLKRLTDAIKDRDNIYAIIKGSGINNDGSERMSFTAPSVHGQAKVIIRAINLAKIKPESVSYIEAHGTATNLGDPIEVEALNLAYGNTSEQKCALGSVKSNIGHLDTAAGVVGLIKTVLSLKNRIIPSSLHYNSPNPKINFKDSRFFVNAKLKEWKNDEYPLRAGVSSFGIGGTNAHVILEEAPKKEQSSKSRACQMLFLSAKTASALERNIENLRDFLIKENDLNLADMAYTLQVGRTHFDYRKMIVCRDRDEAIDLLSKDKGKNEIKFLSEKEKNKIIFLFPGQGSQYVNMCLELYETESVFRDEVDKCFDIVKRISDKNLKPIVFPDEKLGKTTDIHETEYTQPILFIIEYALVKLLNEWGAKADMMIGHSIGEYVAACLSGVFSLEDALLLVVKRGELMQKLAKGSMLAVSISEEDLLAILKDYKNLSLAAVNSSELCVVSGNNESIELFHKQIDSMGFKGKIIRTSHAFHSWMMDEILEEFKKVVEGVEINSQQIPFVSNLTGINAKDSEIKSPHYWVNHLRNTVRFSDGAETMLKTKNVVFIEIGPGKTLTNLIRANNSCGDGHKFVNLVKHSLEQGNDLNYILSGLGKLWLNGVEINWKNYYKKEDRNRISLPTYSFDKIEYPVIVDSYKMISNMLSDKSQIKQNDITEWFYVPTWKNSPLIYKKSNEKKELVNLIFADDLGISDSIVKEFSLCNEKAVCVRVGNSFIKASKASYEVDPNNDEDYYELFENLMKDELLPHRIIHGWGISDISEDEISENDFLSYYNLYFYSLIHIIKASQNQGGILGKQIFVLSNDLHSIVEKEIISPIKSLILGLLKVIPQEFPSVICNHIDVALKERENKDFSNLLHKEIINVQAGKVVSLRKSKRWIQTWDKLVYEKDDTTVNFKKNGVYLITGGLGDLGFFLAKRLQKDYNARIILLGRTEIPSKNDWDEILKNENKNELTKERVPEDTVEYIIDRIKKLQCLENEVGDVLYLQCNVADKKELANAVKTAENKFGSINGVIHSAGVIRGDSMRILLNLEKKDFSTQFDAKVMGIRALNDVFGEKGIDFCLIASSLSAYTGGYGAAAYTPANLYMDYFVKSYNEKNKLLNWVSVNFDILNFEDLNSDHIDANEIFDVINQVLSLKFFSQIVISTKDLNAQIEKYINTIQNTIHALSDSDDIITKGNIVDDESILEKGYTPTEETLIKLWQAFFGISDINVTDDFFDIGGDSLKALTIIGRIHKIFNIELPIAEFFKSPSIKDVGSYIDTNQWLSEKNKNIEDTGKIEVTI